MSTGLDKLDRIILTAKDVISLLKWRDSHKDYVRGFKPVLTEGLIIIGENEEEMQISFQEEGSSYLYNMYKPVGHSCHVVKWNKETKVGDTVYTELGYDKKKLKNYNQITISLHATLMAYMEYFSDKKEYVEVEEISQTKKKQRHKKKGGSKQRTSVVKIRKKIIKVNIPKEAIAMDKQRYERKTESWTVSGHWRYLKKSDKKIWIPSYVKGEGERTPKRYKL